MWASGQAIVRGGVTSTAPPDPPCFFQTPADAIQVAPAGTSADHPHTAPTKTYDAEAELVVALKSGGAIIATNKTPDPEFGCALDLSAFEHK
jgi:fumarylpyruvate hydrolase